MTIKKKVSKKSNTGYSYQVVFSYTDYITKERKTHSKKTICSNYSILFNF